MDHPWFVNGGAAPKGQGPQAMDMTAGRRCGHDDLLDAFIGPEQRSGHAEK
jgi:hypothetical protein